VGLEACLEESTGLATGTIVIIVVASVLIVVIAGVVVVKGHCCDDDDDKEGDIEEAVPIGFGAMGTEVLPHEPDNENCACDSCSRRRAVIGA
jgi:hypothetical protein